MSTAELIDPREDEILVNGARSLAELEAFARRDLEILDYPVKPWLKPMKHASGAHVYDVIVLGAGHTGICAAAGLKREKITNFVVLDENVAGEEGPWATYARMPDLRTRKSVTGAELGYASITYRAYFEARFGAEAYRKLQRITCEEWVSYLQWMRRVFDLPVENGVRIDTFEPDGKFFKLAGARNGKPQTWYCRRLVLASGPLSTGGTSIPEPIAAGLPREKYGHVYNDVNFDALRGKSIIMIGCGASGFDNSGTALEQGAARVDMLVRRPAIPRVSYIRWTDWSAFLNTFADLDDEQKWTMASWVQHNHSPPPSRALARVDKRPDFHIHFDSPILSARMEGDKVVLVTPKGEHRADHVLCATGFSFRLDRAPLFSKVWPHIAMWKDRYQPQESGGSEKFPYSPYVGRHYEFMEKFPGAAPWLKHVYCFSQAATLSMGPTGRVSGLKYGVRRLVMGLSHSFFQEDFDLHLKSVENYTDSEFDDHPWVAKP